MSGLLNEEFAKGFHSLASPTSASWMPSMTTQEEKIEKLLEAVGNLKGELTSMKRTMSEEREAAEDRIMKKIKLDSKPTFKKKSHEKQAQFNASIEDKLDACTSALDEAPPAIDKARDIITEGKKLINARQKLIKIADRSECGWATVEEYMADELASDSDDEKRLFRAENRAKRKLKNEQKKNKTTRKPYLFRKDIGKLVQSDLSESGPSKVIAPSMTRPVTPVAPSGGMLGPCFQCGKPGHLRRFCPEYKKP